MQERLTSRSASFLISKWKRPETATNGHQFFSFVPIGIRPESDRNRLAITRGVLVAAIAGGPCDHTGRSALGLHLKILKGTRGVLFTPPVTGDQSRKNTCPTVVPVKFRPV